MSRPARYPITAFTSLIVFLLTASAIAQENSRVDEVVAQVERRYNRVQTLRAAFIQRFTSGPTTMVESGTVHFRKPGRMRWEYDSPEEKLFLTDGEYAYFYVPAERQVRRAKVKESAHWQTTFALILGRVRLRKVFSRIDLVTLNRAGDPVRWQLRGHPRSGRQGFKQVVFDLDGDYRIRRVEIQQRDGALMEFHFRRWQDNPAVDAELFRPAFPSGTAWIDEGEI